MKKTLSITRTNLSENIIFGFAWMLCGFFGLFDNLICNLFELIFLLIATASLFYTLFHKKEEDDEMSVYHKKEAKATTLTLVVAFLFLFWIASDILSISSLLGLALYSLRFETIVPFLLGFCHFSEGIIFARLERGGNSADIED